MCESERHIIFGCEIPPLEASYAEVWHSGVTIVKGATYVVLKKKFKLRNVIFRVLTSCLRMERWQGPPHINI